MTNELTVLTQLAKYLERYKGHDFNITKSIEGEFNIKIR